MCPGYQHFAVAEVAGQKNKAGMQCLFASSASRMYLSSGTKRIGVGHAGRVEERRSLMMGQICRRRSTMMSTAQENVAQTL